MTRIAVHCCTFQGLTWRECLTDLPGPSVCVYRVAIAEFSPFLVRLQSLLTADERARAARYHRPADQQRFIVARGALRMLLSRYTGQHPADVGFDAGRNKKPLVRGFPAVHYNVSHAGNWVLIATAPAPVGIDVEPIRPDFDYQSVLVPNFSADERRYLAAPAEGRFRFYVLWTRKEALTKATAKGIDDDFSHVPSLDGRHQVAGALLNTTADWRVGTFALPGDYLASVAYAGTAPDEKPVFCNVGPGSLGALH